MDNDLCEYVGKVEVSAKGLRDLAQAVETVNPGKTCKLSCFKVDFDVIKLQLSCFESTPGWIEIDKKG